MLWEIAEFEKASLIVVGNHGRKGPKADLTVCGTAIEYLSLNSKFPCLIIKERKCRADKPDGCLRWGVCFDGSDRSKVALETALKIMRPDDKLTTITVVEEKIGSKDIIDHSIRQMTEKYGIKKLEIIHLEKEDGKSIY